MTAQPKVVFLGRLDIEDTRGKLGLYSRVGLLGADSDGAIPLLAAPAED